jgi:phage terminase large subunit GpA-like protein
MLTTPRSPKAFPAVMLVMTGANSAAALRSTPARYLALDEVDGFPPDCGGEGDPVAAQGHQDRAWSGVALGDNGSVIAKPKASPDGALR